MLIDSPIKTLKDFIEYAKAHPNQATVTTSKPGKIKGFGKEWAHKYCTDCHDLFGEGPVTCTDCHQK